MSTEIAGGMIIEFPSKVRCRLVSVPNDSWILTSDPAEEGATVETNPLGIWVFSTEEILTFLEGGARLLEVRYSATEVRPRCPASHEDRHSLRQLEANLYYCSCGCVFEWDGRSRWTFRSSRL